MSRQALILHRAPTIEGDVCTEASPKYWAALSDQELKRAIGNAMKSVEGSIGRTTSEIRAQLLPALVELKRRLPHGEYGSFLSSIGLKPATVRKWMQRERESVKLLMGVMPQPRPPKQGKEEKDTLQEVIEALLRLAKATLDDPKYARTLASRALDEFGGVA